MGNVAAPAAAHNTGTAAGTVRSTQNNHTAAAVAAESAAHNSTLLQHQLPRCPAAGAGCQRLAAVAEALSRYWLPVGPLAPLAAGEVAGPRGTAGRLAQRRVAGRLGNRSRQPGHSRTPAAPTPHTALLSRRHPRSCTAQRGGPQVSRVPHLGASGRADGGKVSCGDGSSAQRRLPSLSGPVQFTGKHPIGGPSATGPVRPPQTALLWGVAPSAPGAGRHREGAVGLAVGAAGPPSSEALERLQEEPHQGPITVAVMPADHPSPTSSVVTLGTLLQTVWCA